MLKVEANPNLPRVELVRKNKSVCGFTEDIVFDKAEWSKIHVGNPINCDQGVAIVVAIVVYKK